MAQNRILGLGEWETRVSELYSLARNCRLTHAALLERRNTVIHAELNRKHGKRAVYSQWLKGFVAGYMRAKDAELYASHLEFCYEVEGALYSTHKESKHKLTDDLLGTETYTHLVERSTRHGHYWRDTDKPYSVS